MPKIKLTPEDVAGIHYGSSQGASSAALAAMYRVSRIQIWRILKRRQHKGTQALRAESRALNRVNAANEAIVRMLKQTGGV